MDDEQFTRINNAIMYIQDDVTSLKMIVTCLYKHLSPADRQAITGALDQQRKAVTDLSSERLSIAENAMLLLNTEHDDHEPNYVMPPLGE